MTLQSLRDEINTIDQELIDILAKRVALVSKVGSIKKIVDLPPLDPSRWQQVLSTRVIWGQKLGLNPSFIREILETIHKESLRIEEEICHKQ